MIPKNICFFVKGKRLVKLLKDDNTSSIRPCVSMSFMFFVNSTNRLIFSKFIMRKICKKKINEKIWFLNSHRVSRVNCTVESRIYVCCVRCWSIKPLHDQNDQNNRISGETMSHLLNEPHLLDKKFWILISIQIRWINLSKNKLSISKKWQTLLKIEKF